MRIRIFLMVFLAVALAATSLCYAGPSIGVSHYNPKTILYTTNKAEQVALGHVRNTGNVTLHLTYQWTQTSGNSTLQVKIPEPTVLLPDDGVEVCVVIENLTEAIVGAYTVELEVVGRQYPEALGGSPVVVAATLQGKIDVLASTLKPAEFVVYDLTLNETEIFEGEFVHASVNVKNVGEIVGNYTVQVMVDGVSVENVTLTLDGNQAKPLDFAVKMNQTGSHVLAVGNLSSVFNVKAKPESEGVPLLVLGLVVVLACVGCAVGFGIVGKKIKVTKHNVKV